MEAARQRFDAAEQLVGAVARRLPGEALAFERPQQADDRRLGQAGLPMQIVESRKRAPVERLEQIDRPFDRTDAANILRICIHNGWMLRRNEASNLPKAAFRLAENGNRGD